MDFENILTISGKPGLFELKSRTRTGFVIEALEDGKRSSVNSMRNEVRLLAEIAIYTLKEEMPLREVFRKISTRENGQKTEISHKDDTSALEAYFFEIVPDYDEDKVYPSHIKKIIQWYNILQSKAMAFEDDDKTGEKTADEETGEE